MQHHKTRQDRREEQESFVNQFAQSKNLIEKQMKIGRRIKDVKVQKQAKLDIVARLKESRERDKSMDKLAVRSVLFEHQLQTAMFNDSRSLMMSQ